MTAVARLIVMALLLGAGAAVGSATPATACPPGSVSTVASSHVFNTGAQCAHPSPPAGSGHPSPASSTAQPDYQYQAICDRGPGGADGGAVCGQVGEIACGDGGYWFHVTVTYPDGHVVRYDACLEPGETPDQPALTLAMIERAFKQTPVPRSVMSIQPPGGSTLVNLPAIYSTTAAAFTRSFVLVGQPVDLRIVPSSYTWWPGDGSPALVTDEPGTPYSPGLDESAYVQHDYLAVARVSVRVDVTWTATYRVGGAGGWQPVPGSVTRRGVPAPLRVREARGLLTG